MNFVTAQPESLALAAGRLQGIGSALEAQNSATVAPMTALMPAAADPVSLLTAVRFAQHGEAFQTVSAEAVAVRRMFEATLQASAESYAATEAANVATAR